ncbi:LOW QUALITY PROTEIN: hypothetical protein BC936DRAFT_147326 [Jimgerdemannia flammicorona]|uniref:Uncharacterized protein n=1 Tax=Jimgerdemannia flammicorona TaxID=994334 RepID=A0A433DL14_9FUNG|nr:LOW QUALITY PROTEIN: hypothetical protein BC936DRAFT_147326 [Jimgerdemannia flammicorona]
MKSHCTARTLTIELFSIETDQPIRILWRRRHHRATPSERRESGRGRVVSIPELLLRGRRRVGQADYKAGTLATGELKKRCIEVLTEFVSAFQKRKADITDELVKHYMDGKRPIAVEGLERSK